MRIKYESQEKYLDFTKIKTSKKSVGNKIVKNHKMKAGANDYNLNQFQQTFLESCKYIGLNKNNTSFKVLYKMIRTIGLVLFGVELLFINGAYYLPYIYYLFKDTVKFKKIQKNTNSGFTFENLTSEELSQQKLTIIPLLLNTLSDPKKNNYMSNKRNDNLSQLVNKLNEYLQSVPIQEIQTQYSPQTQNSQQTQYSSQTQYSPQMQTQMKIKLLKTELNNTIFQQNKLFTNIRVGINPTQNQKIKLQELLTQQQKLKKDIQKELDNLGNNPITQNIQRQVKIKQQQNLENKLKKLNNQEKKIQELFKKQTFNITKQNLTNRYSFYRCEDPSLEVKIDKDGNIFFGYDEYLFVKSQDDSYKLYYKYSYRNGKFFELIKKKDGTFVEKEIDINLIPTYDILRLYFAIKDNSQRRDLQQKLQKRIDIAKKNISKTGEKFFKLDHSNFDKEKANVNQNKITDLKYKNFGKVKKRRVTQKTYIFFGARFSKNDLMISSNLLYVCFREDNKVFYYDKKDLKTKKDLNEFPYIDPLEDLISFILLRRMITDDTTFADIIYREADARIRFLKMNKFSDKILKEQFYENFEYYDSLGHLHPTKKYLDTTKKYLDEKQTSLLPISKTYIT